MALVLSEFPLLTKALIAAGVFVVLLAVRSWQASSKKVPLPPGPKPHWFFGNEIPSLYPQRKFYEWSKEFGPVMTLQKGRNIWIIISGQQSAIDILEKEGASLVDRPHVISAGEIMSGDMRILLVGSGERFRKLRKALQTQLHIKIVEDYEPIQVSAAKNVILDILEKPEQHAQHVKRYAATVIMSLTYGKTTPTSYSDPEVQEVNRYLTKLSAAMRPGAYLVDSYPFLRYVPGYLNEMKEYHRQELDLFSRQLDTVRVNMKRGDAQPCFAKYLLERQSDYGLSNDELAYLAGSMFGAGSDTTAAAISVVVMAAACFPETQRRVQKQLDAVIGRDRVPSFGDAAELSEVQAFVQESYRWRPVSVGGFPHKATKDIRYGPYVIPAGATVIGNHWALGRDPTVFPDPEVFRPSRWLTESGTMREDMKFYNFGFGRRVCPGQHVANRSLYINTALLLWAFNISQDPTSPIDTLAFTNSANAHPLPFRVMFEPRIPISHLKDLLQSS